MIKGNNNALRIYGSWLIAAAALAGCSNSPTTVAPTQTDTFTNTDQELYAQASALLRADYMFVVDFSYAMENITSNLFNSLENFANDLQSANIDYRIGILDGNFQGNTPSNLIAQNTNSDFVGSVITPGTSSSLFESIIDQVQNVGQHLQPNDIVLLQSSMMTLSAQSSSFIRPDAQLVLVFVSSNDDTSENFTGEYGNPGTEAFYESQLSSFKLPTYTSARAIVAGGSGCAVQNYYESTGQRLMDVAQHIDPTSPAPLCIYNSVDVNLNSLARDVTRPTNRFALANVPESGTLVVTVGGTVEPQAGNWVYNASTNEVIFTTPPAESESVQFNYQIPFILSQTPVASTIQVTVNGATVAQDPTNGWSYLSATNQIQFNGSSLPPNNASISVNYQTQ